MPHPPFCMVKPEIVTPTEGTYTTASSADPPSITVVFLSSPIKSMVLFTTTYS